MWMSSKLPPETGPPPGSSAAATDDADRNPSQSADRLPVAYRYRTPDGRGLRLYGYLRTNGGRVHPARACREFASTVSVVPAAFCYSSLVVTEDRQPMLELAPSQRRFPERGFPLM